MSDCLPTRYHRFLPIQTERYRSCIETPHIHLSGCGENVVTQQKNSDSKTNDFLVQVQVQFSRSARIPDIEVDPQAISPKKELF